MLKFKKYLLAMAVALLSMNILAAVPEFNFRRYNMSSGLTSDMIGALFQDSSGLVWIGHGEGVDSFDGHRMRSYDMLDNGKRLNGVSINCLAEDNDHNLWAGSDDGVYFHSHSDGSSVFRKLSATTASGQNVRSVVTSIAIDQDGLVWMSTRGQGVLCYDRKSDLLKSYPEDSFATDLESLFVDSSNTVWAAVSTENNCLYAFNRADSAFHRLDVDLGPGVRSRIGVMTEDSSSNLWFATWDTGIYMYDRESGKTKRFFDGAKGFYHVHSILELRPGEFLVGSDEGLLWYNVISSESKLFTNDRGSEESLSDRFVYPVMKDTEGGLWVGTYYGGVNYATPVASQFARTTRVNGIETDENFVVSSFAMDPDGTIWVGSDNAGLTHLLENGECVSIPQSRQWNVHAVWADAGYVWVGTYGSGLMRIDKKNNSVRNYSQQSGLDYSSVYAIKRDSKGRLWVATLTGVFTYAEDTDRFVNRYTTGSLCYDIEESIDGDIWFATTGRGVLRYVDREDSWRSYGVDSGTMTTNTVTSLYASVDGNVYATTADGLARYYDSDGTFKSQGLQEYGSLLYVTGDGTNLWVTSTDRLIRYDLADGAVTTYDYGDGMLDGQFIPNAGLMSASGRIYVGTAKGFCSFVPQNIGINEFVLPVLITSFEFRDRKGTAARGGDLYHFLDLDKEISLDWRRNDVRFSFVGLSYCSPAKNRYAYKLEGFDSQWTRAADVSTATYTNLPAGRYRFMVKACNNDGVWNDEGAYIDFRIRQHILRTFAAKILYVLLLLSAAYMVYRIFRNRSLRRMQQSFEMKESEREAMELESKVQFLTSIAHEVRTPLSLIMAPVEKLKASMAGMSDQDRGYLDVIDRNCSRLGRLINQLLDFSRFNQETSQSFDFQKGDVALIVRSVCSSFVPTFDKDGIEFTEEYPEEPIIADVDMESLTTIVMNLLSNAVKYTKDKVSLKCSRDDDFYTIAVSDNGPGISEELRGRIFHPYFRADETSVGTGLGLAILKKLVDALGGNVRVSDAQGGGSIFAVSLPVHQPETSLADSVEDSETSTTADGEIKDEMPQHLKTGKADRQTILIVEDDVDMRTFLVSDFREIYNVLEAPDAETAERLLFQYDVSLVISDWMMPGKSGAELCRFVRSRKTLCQLPFIMLTAKSDDASQLESLDCGADAHVKKPFSPEHLRALVAHLIKMRNMLAQSYYVMQVADSGKPGAKDDFFSRLTEIIESNISNTELSVEMLAKELCVSRSGLFAKVKAVSGDTPNRLIMDIRLKAAAKMLLESNNSVSEISYMVGFNSPSYFSKCFSAQYGMTPHQWMEKHKNT